VTSFQALATGLILFALATLIATIRPARTHHRVFVAIVIALLTSGASAAISSERPSGTGTLMSRGYPRAFYFRWTDFERVQERTGMNLLYFGANTTLHLGVIAVVAAAWPHRRTGSPTMPVRMLVIRLVLGVVFLILAVIGAFLPIIQGWLFFLLAMLVLFPRTAFAEKVLLKAEPKLPKLVAWLRRLGIGTQYQ
jgi:hypothetical protein